MSQLVRLLSLVLLFLLLLLSWVWQHPLGWEHPRAVVTIGLGG